MKQTVSTIHASGTMLPDEKAHMYGMFALTDAELLAILLRSGSKGNNVLALSEQILREWGSLRGIVSASPEQIRDLPGVGRVKELQILAVAELSRRIWRSTRDLTPVLNNSQEVYDHFREDLRNAEQEEVHLALLDVKCRLQRRVVLTRGTLRSSVVSPREVFSEALTYHAASFVMLHNHPSGDSTPSREDISITKTLYGLGMMMQLPMLDHIIIGNPGYFSFKDSGMLSAE